MRQGSITTNGVILHHHENATVVYLTQQGYDITIIPPDQRKGVHTPDIIMLNKRWEMKCPIGRSPHTIKRAFKVAIHQSEYIIFDLRRSKITDAVNIARLKKEFHDIKRVKRLIIIPKSKKIIDISK